MTYPYYNPSLHGQPPQPQQPNGQAGHPAPTAQPPQQWTGIGQQAQPQPQPPQHPPQSPQQPSPYGPPPTQQPYNPPAYQPPSYPSQQPPTQPAAAQPPGYQGQPLDSVVPNVSGMPTEWVGRPWRDVLRVYDALKQHYMQTRQGGQPTQSQPPAQQPPQGYGQPRPQGQPAQPQGQPTQGQFFTNPDEAVRNIVREELAPVVQNSIQAQINDIRREMAQRLPDYVVLEPEILESLQAVDPRALANPAMWENAYDLVRGRAMRRAAAGQQYGQPQPSQNQGFATQGYGAPSARQAVPGVGPTPMGMFFTEGVTPGSQAQGAAVPTQQDVTMAARLGLSPQDIANSRAAIARGELPNV